MKEQPSGVVFNYITSEVKSLKLVFPILRKITGELFEKVRQLYKCACVCMRAWLRVCRSGGVNMCVCVHLCVCVCVRIHVYMCLYTKHKDIKIACTYKHTLSF
jgi:hypothetical protein